MKKSTQCVHSGTIHSTIHPGVNTPVFTSTASGYMDSDKLYYPRYFNTPNQDAVAKKITLLENGESGLVFASGMAAISTTLLALLNAGDHVIFQKDLYGGTYHFATTSLEKYGISYSIIDVEDEAKVREVLQPQTKLIYIETPSNPLLQITDMAKVAAIARKHNLLTAIDNTFASPINQNPIDHGIDVVLHSGTKYLGGHSDMCCGAMVTSGEIAEIITEKCHQLGGSLDANSCYLLERSIKTLKIRVEQQNKNALAIARLLKEHPVIENVYYPGLEDHPGYLIAKNQMAGFGGMMAFEIKGDKTLCHKFLRNLKLIQPATSLGGVESVVCVPAETSHAEVTPEERLEMGIKDQLIRLSTGIEDSADLWDDLRQALEKI